MAELAGPESIKAIQASVARIAAINASSIDKLPGVSGLAMDGTGKVVFQQLDDGASQFPALMIGDDIEAVQSQSGMILRSRASGQEFIHIKRNSLITPGQELFLGEHGVAEAQADRQGRTFSETAADGTRLFAAISIGGIDIVQTGKGLSLIRRQTGRKSARSGTMAQPSRTVFIRSIPISTRVTARLNSTGRGACSVSAGLTAR